MRNSSRYVSANWSGGELGSYLCFERSAGKHGLVLLEHIILSEELASLGNCDDEQWRISIITTS